MKLNKLLTIAYIGIATISTSSVVNAMDAEFAGYNHQKAQVMGTKYKKDLAVEKTLRLGGVAPAALSAPAAVNTLDLLKAASGDVPALDSVKGRAVAALKVRAVTLLDNAGANDAAVVFDAAALTYPAGTRANLKALVDAAIDLPALAGVAAPVSGDLDALTAKRSEIFRALNTAIETAVNTLGANDAANVLTPLAASLLSGIEHAALGADEARQLAAYQAGIAGAGLPPLGSGAAAVDAAYVDGATGTPITPAQAADAAQTAAHAAGIADEAIRQDAVAGNPAPWADITRAGLKNILAAALA